MRTLRGYQVSGAEADQPPGQNAKNHLCVSVLAARRCPLNRSFPRRSCLVLLAPATLCRQSLSQPVSRSSPRRRFESRFLLGRVHLARRSLEPPVGVRPRAATVSRARGSSDRRGFHSADPTNASIYRIQGVESGDRGGREREREREKEQQAPCNARSSLHRSSFNRERAATVRDPESLIEPRDPLWIESIRGESCARPTDSFGRIHRFLFLLVSRRATGVGD